MASSNSSSISVDAVRLPRNADSAASGDKVMLGLVCILLFLAINPFLALFLLSIVAVFRRIPMGVFIVSASIAFTLFFFSRDYGIEWYLGSTDDVPDYIAIYHETYGLSFTSLIDYFFESPNGHELLWSMPVWALSNLFDVSDNTFVFLHYLAIFTAVFLALSTFSKRYLVPLVLVYFFLTPISIDAISHIWRQQMAFSVILAGIGLYTVRRKRIGQWFIFLSPLVHISSLFFVMGFVTFKIIRANRGFDNKLKFSIALIVLLTAVPLFSSLAVSYLDALGLARIMSYFEGNEPDVLRVYLLVGLYVVPMLASFYLLENDDTNHLLMILSISVFTIVVGLPASNGIYDRLLMSAIPFLGLYFYRCYFLNFSSKWHLPLLLLVFYTGAMRLYNPTLEQSGPMFFVAYGHAFDPFMGVVKLLVNL
jgi:EpsG family